MRATHTARKRVHGIRPRQVRQDPRAETFHDQLASILSAPPESSKKRKLSEVIDVNDRVQSLKTNDKGVKTPRSNRSNSKPSQSSSRGSSVFQESWDRVARRAGAAKVTIVNDIDYDGAPPVDPNFQYLENRCTYAIDVQDSQTVGSKTFTRGCDCEGSCSDIRTCSCISSSQCIDANGERTVAYDENGLFLFTDGGEVVNECNENCSCSRGCRNRVAQKPRKIPIEIFKTVRNGWGVRSPIACPQGTVIGVYTGKFIRHEAVADLSDVERDYTYEPDTPDNALLERYAICAYAEGNWTRFINHSCSPTAEVFRVDFDGTLESKIPYLAFVASEDIPAWKEITVDYDPDAARNAITGKGVDEKNNRNASSSETQCLCGSENCRGIIPGGLADDIKGNTIEDPLEDGPVRYSMGCDRCIRSGIECQGMLFHSACFSCAMLKEECKHELGGLRLGFNRAQPYYSSVKPFIESDDGGSAQPGMRPNHASSEKARKTVPDFLSSAITLRMLETTAQAFGASAQVHSSCSQTHEACIRMQKTCVHMQQAWTQVLEASIQAHDASLQVQKASFNMCEVFRMIKDDTRMVAGDGKRG